MYITVKNKLKTTSQYSYFDFENNPMKKREKERKEGGRREGVEKENAVFARGISTATLDVFFSRECRKHVVGNTPREIFELCN